MAARQGAAWVPRLRRFRRPAGRRAEAIHELHRDLRRSRFEGQILGRILGAPKRDRSLERPAELREFERVLGRWRDLEMTRELFRSAAAHPSDPAERRWLSDRDREFLAEIRRHERESLQLVAALLGHRAPAGRISAAPGRLRRLEEPARWRRELDARRRRYLKALRRLEEPLAAEPAHAFRQELRRLGVFYDLLAAAPWAAPRPRPRKVQRVLDRLGRLHDLDRALVRLSRAPRGPVRDALGRRLRAERRRAEEKARRALRSRATHSYAEGSVRKKR